MVGSRELKLLCSLLLCQAAAESHDIAKDEIKLEGTDIADMDHAEEMGVDSDEEVESLEVFTVSGKCSHEHNGSLVRKSTKRSKNSQAKRKKLKTQESNLGCSYCGKHFVRAEGLARHVAGSHVFETTEDFVRCLFDGCDFTMVAAAGGSCSELRQHELAHSCPVCRSIYPSQDQIRCAHNVFVYQCLVNGNLLRFRMHRISGRIILPFLIPVRAFFRI